MNAEARPDVIVAFDYGERRIGVATGNRHSATASPLGVVRCRAGEADWSEIERIFEEWAPGAFIVGQPPSGNPQLLENLANFVQALEKRYKLPVYLVDESHTSQAAEAVLAEERRAGTRKKRVRRGDVDPVAASMIAQRWLAKAYLND